MKQWIALTLGLATMAANANYQWVSVGKDTLESVSSKLSGFVQDVRITENNGDVAALEVNEAGKAYLSHLMHAEFKRCPGFIAHDSLEEAEHYAQMAASVEERFSDLFIDYSITENDRVRGLVAEVDELNIKNVILKLSSYHNRYYTADTGVASSNWIRDHWASIAANRSDIKVELYNHPNWPQPSVIMTIEGSEAPEDIVVIGGHADSIAGFWGGRTAKAPGADDNASGIATITETLRILIENGYRPKKTIQFMAYSAEEVGLKGSKEIAQRYKNSGKNVIGTMQLDMTNFKGSSQYDIVMMSDFTNADQNAFLGRLIDEYVQVPWGYSQCGYGCSDHASWHLNGFPASMPFEAMKNDMNGQIHTARDTLGTMGGDASHAVNFSRLAVAFAVEMAK